MLFVYFKKNSQKIQIQQIIKIGHLPIWFAVLTPENLYESLLFPRAELNWTKPAFLAYKNKAEISIPVKKHIV